MDFTLLYCAKLVVKNRAHVMRIVIAAIFGACFAVMFPLLGLGGVWAVAVKIIFGAVICFICGKFKNFKAYFKLTAVFSGFTFVLGGALIAVFSLSGIDYSAGNGYILSSVPIGIPLFCALLLVIAARKIAQRLKKSEKAMVECRIYCGDGYVDISGFFDSGNKVKHLGQPVSVIPLHAAMQIVDAACINQTVKIHTVAGSKKIKIFTADKMEIRNGEKTDIIKDVKIGISPHASGVAVLHPDLLED